MTKSVTLPNGTTVFGADVGVCPRHGTANTSCTIEPGETVTVPGPRITVPPGDTTLTINLMNCLPEATSLVIPGQPFTALPVRTGDRVRSMTPEATANGGTASYTFTGLKPGTFLYQSGSHPAVQVQMGLYGAMTKDASAGNAYAGVVYQHEAVLVYSEIDQALHEAVSAGTYGTDAGPTSTIDYRPSLFLINGESYTTDAVATVAAGTADEVTLLRILNAGLHTHAPVLDNGTAEHRGGGRQQAALRARPGGHAAGRRQDARRGVDAAGHRSLQPVRPHAQLERARPGLGRACWRS